MPTPKFEPYSPGMYDDADKKIKGLSNAYIETTRYLQYILFHLDEKNVIRAKSVVADWVYAGNVTTDQLTAGTAKISTALIESLEVGSNVTMGPNAYISWNNVTDQPAPYTDAEALAAWVASGYKTYIDENGVYTGTLTADQINAISGISLGSGASIDWNYVTKPNYTADEVGALPDTTEIPTIPSYIKSTYIDASSVSSPAIRGGLISGAVYTNLTGTVSNPTYSYCLELGDYDGHNAFSFFKSSNVDTDPPTTSNTIFAAYDGDFSYTALSGKSNYTFLITRGDLSEAYPYGNWNFTNATVTGLPSSVYKFG